MDTAPPGAKEVSSAFHTTPRSVSDQVAAAIQTGRGTPRENRRRLLGSGSGGDIDACIAPPRQPHPRVGIGAKPRRTVEPAVVGALAPQPTPQSPFGLVDDVVDVHARQIVQDDQRSAVLGRHDQVSTLSALRRGGERYRATVSVETVRASACTPSSKCVDDEVPTAGLSTDGMAQTAATTAWIGLPFRPGSRKSEASIRDQRGRRHRPRKGPSPKPPGAWSVP